MTFPQWKGEDLHSSTFAASPVSCLELGHEAWRCTSHHASERQWPQGQRPPCWAWHNGHRRHHQAQCQPWRAHLQTSCVKNMNPTLLKPPSSGFASECISSYLTMFWNGCHQLYYSPAECKLPTLREEAFRLLVKLQQSDHFKFWLSYLEGGLLTPGLHKQPHFHSSSKIREGTNRGRCRGRGCVSSSKWEWPPTLLSPGLVVRAWLVFSTYTWVPVWCLTHQGHHFTFVLTTTIPFSLWRFKSTARWKHYRALIITIRLYRWMSDLTSRHVSLPTVDHFVEKC